MHDEQNKKPEQLMKDGVGCQLEAFPSQFDQGPPSRQEPWSWYFRRRARGAVRKIMRLVSRLIRRPSGSLAAPAPLAALELEPGDVVRVRSADFINRSLDENGRYRGCAFALGMYQYCGQELRVIKVVKRFFDEAQSRWLQARNMVLLEGAFCDGSSLTNTRGCDRMCFYFWRTEWLEKIENTPGQGKP
jgi:hypothetical protein